MAVRDTPYTLLEPSQGVEPCSLPYQGSVSYRDHQKGADRGGGIEPPSRESKSYVMPLDHPRLAS